MKRFILLALAMVGCEQKPTSVPRAQRVEPEPLVVDLTPDNRESALAPLPAMSRDTGERIAPIPEFDEPLRLARLRLRFHQAQVVVQQQEALIAYVDRLELDYVRQWKPDGDETGPNVVEHMRIIHRFREELIAERDKFREQLEESERALSEAEHKAARTQSAEKS